MPKPTESLTPKPRVAVAPHILRARRGIAVLFFALGFGYANWLARIPAVREQLHLSDGELGLLLLFGGTGAVCAFRVSSLVLKKLPSGLVASSSSAAFALFLGVPAVATAPWQAATALWLAGFVNGLLDVAVNAQAVTVERQMGRPILAAVHAFFSLGGFAGAATGAAAAGLDVTPAAHLFAIGLALAAVSWWAGLALLPDEAAPPILLGAGKQRLPRILLVLGIIALCSAVGEGAIAEWAAIYLRDVLRTGMGLAGLGYAVFSAAMVLGRLIGERWVGHLEPQWVLSRCGLLAAGSLTFALIGNTPLLFVVGLFGCGTGLSLVVPTVLRLAVRVPDIRPAYAISEIATLGYGGFLLGPPTIGLGSQLFGLRVALSVVVLLCCALAAIGWLLPRPR